MPLVRAYSRNLGQHLIFIGEKGHFLKKGHQKFCFLRRNKALYNFHKRGQCLIVERDIGLEYALLVASNFHIEQHYFTHFEKM